jgi:hypothetical protein
MSEAVRPSARPRSGQRHDTVPRTTRAIGHGLCNLEYPGGVPSNLCARPPRATVPGAFVAGKF